MSNSWKILNRKTVFKSKWRNVDKFLVRVPSGKRKDLFATTMKDVVVVFPLTTDKKVVVNRQYHFYYKKRRYELCAGFIENGSRLQAAKQELLEETGYRAKKYIYLGCAGIERWNLAKVYYYLALDAEKIADQSLEGAEDIIVELIPLQKFKKMLKENKIDNGLSIVGSYKALDYLESCNI